MKLNNNTEDVMLDIIGCLEQMLMIMSDWNELKQERLQKLNRLLEATK